MSKYTFGIKSADSYLLSLSEAYRQFRSDDLDANKALDCAMRAWHISEWIYKEFNLEATQGTLQQYQKRLASAHDFLAFMHDVANGLKHCTLSQPLSSVDDSGTHLGDFSNDFDFSFDVSCLVLKLEDDTERIFILELEKAIEHWRAYLDGLRTQQS